MLVPFEELYFLKCMLASKVARYPALSLFPQPGATTRPPWFNSCLGMKLGNAKQCPRFTHTNSSFITPGEIYWSTSSHSFARVSLRRVMLIGESNGISCRAYLAQPIIQSVHMYIVTVCCTLSFLWMVADSGSHAPKCHFENTLCKVHCSRESNHRLLV